MEPEPIAVVAERIARKRAKQMGMSGLWEMFLFDAYREAAGLTEPSGS